jgi:hypothetical protein
VTSDGAIFTGSAELCFFYGDALQPVMARQKTFLDGWIPVVQYDWEERGLHYFLEIFGAAVDGIGAANSIQFAQIVVKNESGQAARAVVAAASRLWGNDHRFGGKAAVAPETRYEMKDNGLYRNGDWVYSYPAEAQVYAVTNVPYQKAFTASEHRVEHSTPVAWARLAKELKPGESCRWVFKMPNIPVAPAKREILQCAANADYDACRRQVVAYWRKMIEAQGCFYIPEKRVHNSYRAGLVHLMLATREKNGKKQQGSGLPYDALFFNDYVDMRRLYDVSGHPEFVEINVQWLLSLQAPSGMFLDPVLTHGSEIMASHGQALVSLAGHYAVTRDMDYARKVYPAIRKAVDWMYRKHKEDKYGLMPESTPFDAEMIKGYYTSHNLWCLLALRDALRVAKALGEQEDVASWTEFHQTYSLALQKAIDTSAAKDGGYVPTGLYDFITGPAARKGFQEHQTNQDWENNLLVYPTEVLPPDDDRVRATVETIRKRKYREGIMTYRNGMHLHQYATVNQAHQYLAMNDQRQTLLDLYHILLHNGSTHEGFENAVEPWEDMDPWPIPPPHAWAAAKQSLLIRNMLLREQGGQAGLDEKERDLHLFSVVSPEWARAGNRLRIDNALTEMGRISADMSFAAQGAQITLQSTFHTPPRQIKIAIPYFVELKNVRSDAAWMRQEKGYILLAPGVSQVTLEWEERKNIHRQTFQNLLLGYRQENSLDWRGKKIAKIIPGNQGFLLPDEREAPPVPLSFEVVKNAFIKEYTRRFEEYTAAGKKPIDFGVP